MQAWWIRVNNSACKRLAGFFSHIFKLFKSPSTFLCSHRLMLLKVLVAKTTPMERSEEDACKNGTNFSAKGRARSIPVIPTNRSTTRDAVAKDADIPIRIAPASRTTSPPIVVGRTLDENKPAKVSLRLSLASICSSLALSKLYQRPKVEKREVKPSKTKITKVHHGICPKLSSACCQPTLESKKTITPRDSNVPTQRIIIRTGFSFF